MFCRCTEGQGASRKKQKLSEKAKGGRGSELESKGVWTEGNTEFKGDSPGETCQRFCLGFWDFICFGFYLKCLDMA